MAQPDQFPTAPQKRIEEYDNNPIWLETFKRHGINEKHLKCWFFNYECETENQKFNLEKLKVLCRRNNICIALLGEVGNGKTHLATSVLKDHIICSKKNSPGHYYTLTGLFREYRQSISSDGNSEFNFMERLFNYDCLVIDEMQIKSDSEAEQRMFQELIDKRYAMEKQTIFVGNMLQVSFEKMLGVRLLDRMFENGLEILLFSEKSFRRR